MPVTVTVLPPACGPVVRVDPGDRRRGVVGVLSLALVAEVPLGVVTVTSTVPVPAGDDDREGGAQLVTLIELPAVGAEVDGGGPGRSWCH